MNVKKLNEKLSKLLEISDETKKSYLDKRQAQVNKAQKNLEKAKKSVAKSDQRQISNLPQRTSLENAEKALNTLKSEMKKVSNGSDWRLEEDEDGEYLNLSVRYWGQWNDRDEDDDWAPLDDKYKQILDDILVKVQKQHGVQIINQGSEKKWLSFDILLDDSGIEDEKLVLEVARKVYDIIINEYPSMEINVTQGGFPNVYLIISSYNDNQCLSFELKGNMIAIAVIDNNEGTEDYYTLIHKNSVTVGGNYAKEEYYECADIFIQNVFRYMME